MALTSLAVENAKPKEKPYKLSDGDGLHLLVQTNGSKLWRFRYRFGAKENMLALGSFPEISLASARIKRQNARKLLSDGIDPSQQKKQNRIAASVAANNTFGSIVTEYLTTQEQSGAADKTMAKNRWLLQDLASPFATRPISQITPAEILHILKKVEKSGRRETARRLRGAISTIFRLAVATLRAPNDPTYALKGALAAPIVVHRPAVTDERKLGSLMVSIDEYDGWPTLKNAMLFLALTIVRPGEVRYMHRSEVIWPQSIWRIPKERMKMREPHDVPLSRQALATLRNVWDLSEGNGLVFPSIRSSVKPLSENALNSALRRMGYANDEMCAHGFRTSASTILNQRQFDGDVIEVALAHQEQNDVRAAYNRAKYWPQRVALLQAWADLLDDFRNLSLTRTVA